MDDLLKIFELDELPDSDVQLKKQYYKLSKKWHPDKNVGKEDTTEHFKAIGEVYEKLKLLINGFKTKKRKFEDMTPKHFFDPNVDPATNCTHNLNAYVSVTLEQIFTGAKVNVKIKRQEVCTKCTKGDYYKYYTCAICRSERLYYKEEEFEIEVPRSCKEGFKIILQGESHRSFKAKSGDLNVFIKIVKHAVFKIKGKYNLKMTQSISVHEVISRKKFTIETIDKQKYHIKKPKYQTFMPNTYVKIKYTGLFDPERGKRGHTYVYFDVKDYHKMKREQKMGWFQASECLMKRAKKEEFCARKNIRIVRAKKNCDDMSG